MTPEIFLRQIVRPGLYTLGAHSTVQPTLAAERFLVAIALQESDATHRYQNSPAEAPGPARGFWQFERIAVSELLTNARTKILALEACQRAHVVAQPAAAHRAIEGHDRLATAFARLLVLLHASPLPETEAQGWQQYRDQWRPGRPRAEKWSRCWQQATDATLRQEVPPDADPASGTV